MTKTLNAESILHQIKKRHPKLTDSQVQQVAETIIGYFADSFKNDPRTYHLLDLAVKELIK